MNQQQKPADYYVVLPREFDLMIQTIAQRPYLEVAGLLNQINANTRPMYGEPPEVPKFSGPGGRVVPMPEADPPLPDDPDAGQTDDGGAKS